MRADVTTRSSGQRRRVVLISPALAAANNGNWQTARRWTRYLRNGYRVVVQQTWDGSPADAMVALHARRSADSIERFARTGRGLAVVLTGTDLYRDIEVDPTAQRSLKLAATLVVLQQRGLDALPTSLHAKTRVIHQSAPELPPATTSTSAPSRCFDLLLVGHLRAEKDPMTALRALSRLRDPRFRLRHVGAIGDAPIAPLVAQAAAADPRIELLGPRSHGATRQFIRRGHLLLLPSLMEGGANVLIEAVTCSVPVLASRVSGNLGMLGDDYPGYFEIGGDAELARLIERCRREPEFLGVLRRLCIERARLFTPRLEARAVCDLVKSLFVLPEVTRDD